MKIAFLVDTFPALSETFILNQITGLIDLGHEVRIFAACPSKESTIQPEVEKYDLRALTRFHNNKPKCPICRVISAIVPFFKYVRYYPRVILRSLNVFKYGKEALSLNYFYKAVAFLSDGDFDVLQCHFGRNGELGALLKELGVKGKLVTMFHGYGIRKGIVENGNIYARLFKYGDAFLSISEYNRKHLLEFGAPEEKIIDHPVGIDPRKFQLKEKPQEGPLNIVTIARLVDEKNIPMALRVIRELIYDCGEELRYRIVGGGPLEEQLKLLAEEMGIVDKVEFLGAMGQDGIVDVLNSSDIFILTSREEALPVVLMEAQAAGLPVVATDVGSVSQALNDGLSGFLVPYDDEETFKDKIMMFVRDRSRIVAMGEAGRHFIEERYDIRKLNTRLEQIYKGLVYG